MPSADTRLLLCIAIGQTIGWGTLFSTFALFGAPMEAELGWSRASINAGLTLAMLVSGLVAVPVGQHVDRHGGRRMLAWGAWLGAALLATWSCTDSLALYWALWAGMGLAQAAALWGPAMAVVVTAARDPARTITGITFITGFTGTIFVPLGAALIAGLGWRQALLALAALQVIPGLLALWLLPQPPPRAASTPRGDFSLRDAVRRPAFLGLAGCFAAHAFIGIGLGAHAIPLLRERGLPEASVLLIVALHGPFQVAARLALFALGGRVTMRGVGLMATLLTRTAAPVLIALIVALHGPFQVAARLALFALGGRVTMRGVGLMATLLTPVGMLVLALAPPEFAWLVLFALCWAIADGLMTIVRAAGVAEILGREGYGAITGALSVATVLPRTAAPVLIALIWEGAGGYGPVPWLLTALACLGAAAFSMAARAR